MKKYNVLVLTDHSNHSRENSLYALVSKLQDHSLTFKVDIATRANKVNLDFFESKSNAKLFVNHVGQDFTFTDDGAFFSKDIIVADLKSYDLVWLRMPPPLRKTFLDYLDHVFNGQIVINNPSGIFETGSKEFLINFKDYCPPMKICKTKDDIIEFKNRFPVVLKPYREYGGKGIVKIAGEDVWSGKYKMNFDHFLKALKEDEIEYLGVKYLQNVTDGDKRIIVVNGEIMGASLRLPPEDSWICNVAMGGSSHIAEVDDNEREIVEAINPILSKMGIVMYGLDTLVGDDGKRVLSEINTTSIGGLPQIAKLRKEPLVEEAVDLIWSYFNSLKK